MESGRRDPVTGAVHPWPWTVNAEGQGYFYDTKAEAVAAVRAMQARGIRSIDVGCGQINLMHHPDAFPSLEQAFDPQANAAYAARFLKELFAQTGDWNKATALYHSATPELGAEYQRKVLAVWPEEQRLAGLVGATPLAQAWGATHRRATAELHPRAAQQPRDGAGAADHHAAHHRRRGTAWPRPGRLPGDAHRSRLPAAAAPHRRIASGGEFGADRRGVLADRRHRTQRARPVAEQHRRRGERHRPFGVSTVARRSAGWRENAATSLTKPYAVLAARSFSAACARDRRANTAAICASTIGAVGDADDVGLETLALRQLRFVEELRAELHPFAFVLDGDQHQRAILGGECAIGQIDGCARPSRSGARPVPS